MREGIQSTKYWLHDDSKRIASYMDEYRTKWSLWANSPFKQAWLRNYIAYYSPVVHPGSWDTSLIFEGVQGELVRFYTPKARVLTRQLVNIVTKQRLSFQASAHNFANSDIVSDLKLANAVAESIVETERLDLKDDALVEGGIVTGNWFTKTTWRTDKGQPYTRGDNGEPIYTGGVDISLVGIWDCFYDCTLPWEQLTWAEARTTKNRWDLIAQHPDLKQKILALPSTRQDRGPNNWFDRTISDEDLIFVYELYVKPSPALPKGRMVVYADTDVVFFDDINPYRGIPIEPLTPEPVMGTGLGYPQFTNIIAAQEMFDNSLSAIATNQAQFAVQSVAVPRGAEINVMELNGMRFVNYTPQAIPGGGLPTPLQLTQSSPETFKFANMLGQEMQDLSYLNGALRGNPPAGVTSGVAIATLSANAIEFLTSISKARAHCWEKTLMWAVKCHIIFGHVERQVQFKGRNSQITSKPYVGKDLENISGMKMQLSNPLMQTVAGRLEIAQQLIAMPKEAWPPFVSVLEGRPLADVYKGELTEEDCINSENDDMQQGQQVPVLASDDHPRHIMMHKALLNDPEVRRGSPNAQIILDHIMAHKELAQTMDPFLAAMLATGKMPQGGPPPPPMQGPPPGPGGPPHGPGPMPPQSPIAPPRGPGTPGMPPPGGGPNPNPKPPNSVEAPLPLSGQVAKPANDLLKRQGAPNEGPTRPDPRG